ncbi:MAG: LysM peptidoglycan-binding domain-containing M23 family metallopeptidase [Magnetospirillum sp.]|nr:LysM peptidoglycan-binding domain-containing M23 family metallopeptidase [Magnetospirillum sp.]
MASILVLPALLAACESSWPAPSAGVRASPQETRWCPSPLAVYAGETVYSVARRCGVSVRELIDANGLQPPYALSPGMTLRIPGGQDYVVRRGDTLLGLARRFHVGFQTLASVNNKRPPYTIRLGEHLRVPNGGNQTGQGGAQAAPGGFGSLVIASPNAVQAASEPAPSLSPPPSSREAMAAPPPPPVPEGARETPREARGDVAPPPRPAEQASGTPQQPQQAVAVPPEPKPETGRGFLWPVKGEVIAGFGPQGGKGQSNDGINIAAPRGTQVRAAENGVVAYVGNELKGFGSLILIKHADGWMTAYAHNDQILVHRGETVKRGQPIATVGSTGSVTAPQLHFEMRHGTEAVDPAEYLAKGPVSRREPPAGGPDGPPGPG